ncbi:MAG: hypothetical protein KTR32_05385 [Granulosicoccus sp.]|nr:hypothetical protein [Granulosicoccus sp.]
MEHWNNFLNFEYSNEVLIVVGALLLLFGVMRILSSSLKLIFWVLLSGMGGFAVAYGVERSGSDIPVNLSQEIKSLVGPGRELSIDAMRVLCDRLDTESPEQ